MKELLIEWLPRLIGAVFVFQGVQGFRRSYVKASSEGADEKEYFGRRAKIIACLWILFGLFLVGAFGSNCQAMLRQAFLGSS